MDEAKLTEIRNSLQELRDEVRNALARLDQDLQTMRSISCSVELRVDSVRNAAYEALAEIRHITGQLRTDGE